jgi:hypothetical protein
MMCLTVGPCWWASKGEPVAYVTVQYQATFPLTIEIISYNNVRYDLKGQFGERNEEIQYTM